MQSVSKEQLFRPLKRKFVAVPGFDGGGVYVQEPTARARDTISVRVESIKQLDEDERAHRFRVELVTLLTVDENGQRFFADADREAVSGMPGETFDPIADEALAISGFGMAAQEQAAKN